MVGGYLHSFSRYALFDDQECSARKYTTWGFAEKKGLTATSRAVAEPNRALFEASESAFREKLCGYPRTTAKRQGFYPHFPMRAASYQADGDAPASSRAPSRSKAGEAGSMRSARVTLST